MGKDAQLIPARVDDTGWNNSRPQVRTRSGMFQAYDLLVAATGVNTAALKLFEEMPLGYTPQT